MNRRSFLRNLALGAASLPVAVKVAMEAPKPNTGLTFRMLKEARDEMISLSMTREWRVNPAWENAEYRVDFITHASERRTAERIAKAMSGQKPYNPECLRCMGLEWHRGQAVRAAL
jgi:hypothetical protein